MCTRICRLQCPVRSHKLVVSCVLFSFRTTFGVSAVCSVSTVNVVFPLHWHFLLEFCMCVCRLQQICQLIHFLQNCTVQESTAMLFRWQRTTRYNHSVTLLASRSPGSSWMVCLASHIGSQCLCYLVFFSYSVFMASSMACSSALQGPTIK